MYSTRAKRSLGILGSFVYIVKVQPLKIVEVVVKTEALKCLRFVDS